LSGDSNIDSKEGSSNRDPLCWETLQGATELNPDLTGTRVTPAHWGEHLLTGSGSSGNLEVLEETVSTLDVQNEKKNRGGDRKRARKARLVEAPTGNFDRVQPQ
jgi:hypothetical protein